MKQKYSAEDIAAIAGDFKIVGDMIQDCMDKVSTPIKNSPVLEKTTTINFSNRRIHHFFKFLGNALEILTTGHTSIIIKKKL